MTTEHVIILTTWPDQDSARLHATTLLKNRLAACINILPEMQSLYVWEGELESGKEHQMIIKTTTHQIAAVQQAIVDSHPYECPEILVVPVTGGFPDYLNWIKGNTE